MIWAAAICADHLSSYVYTHLMRNSNQESNLEAKTAYEKHCAIHGVVVQRYHTYNGRFADPEFHKAVEDSNQRITSCGIGSHYHNGIAERFIK